jgi:hypothetical protein
MIFYYWTLLWIFGSRDLIQINAAGRALPGSFPHRTRFWKLIAVKAPRPRPAAYLRSQAGNVVIGQWRSRDQTAARTIGQLVQETD